MTDRPLLISPELREAIAALLSDENVIRVCAEALYEKLDNFESGEWTEISESWREHYCASVEWLRDDLLLYLDKSISGFPTTT